METNGVNCIENETIPENVEYINEFLRPSSRGIDKECYTVACIVLSEGVQGFVKD